MMTVSTYKPFGTVITNAPNNVDFSTDAGFKFVSKNKEENMSDIINSAVGDFTERPLQIMIREIAKNFLIFTPIGWIILLFIIGRKYKGNLKKALKNINIALKDAVKSLCEDGKKDNNEQPEEKQETPSSEENPV